jgi:hypothetical protein
LEKEFPAPVGLHFSDTLLGWDLPHKRFSRIDGADSKYGYVDHWAWLRPIAAPTLRQVAVNTFAPLPDKLPALAQRVPSILVAVEVAGYRSEQNVDDVLRLLLSNNTQELSIMGGAGDLDSIAQAPQLKRLDCTRMTATAFAAVFEHPRLEAVSCMVKVDDLTQLPGGKPCALRRLRVTFDWPDDDAATTTTGQYAWVERCAALSEINVTWPDSSFLGAVGWKLGGVDSLEITGVDAASLEQLASWTRLRRLTLELTSLEDRQFAAIGNIAGSLESLEIDGANVEDPMTTISPQALEALKRFDRLRRLRIDCCNLGKDHIAVLADLTQLEELSLEYNPLDDAAIAPLHRLPRLRLINLDNTEVSDRQFENIRGDWKWQRAW